MAQGDPSGWENLGTNDPTRYRATFRLNRNQESGRQTKQNVRVITNRSDGNYDVYTTTFGVGDELIYSYNTSTDEIIISNQEAYQQIFTGNNGQQLTNLDKDVKKATLELAENNVSGNPDSTSYKDLQNLKNSQGYKSLGNAAKADPPPGGNPPPGDNPPQQTPQLTPLEDPTIESDYNRKDYSDLVYPTNLRKNKQDFIQFKSYEYSGRGFSPSQTSSGYSLSIGERGLNPRDGSVTLPVQPSISDKNTVQWGSGDLNAIGAYVASTSYGLMGNNPGQAATTSIDTAFEVLSNDPNIGKAIKLAAAGRAAGVSGLLSRVGGAILNPNIELLFQGPQLRPFNFTFRLSARDGDEAETIKKIIRYFKQNMSVKTTSDNIFLKAPNVFKIFYNNGDGGIHESLNRIKVCALTAFNVDYTPDSQYMTFKDSAKGYPMTSYGLSMQFQELEPVTEKDYEPLKDNEIGY